MSIITRLIDERFLAHRQRATSIGGMAAVAMAMCLFMWHLYFDNILNWDLFAVGLTAVIVKLTVMIWSGLMD